jgi:hypothetical protein
VEVAVRDREGRLRLWVLTCSPLRDREGRPRGALGIARDITDRREMEERLRESERLASVGTLAAPERPALQRLADGQEELLRVHGLGEVVQRSQLDHFHGRPGAALGLAVHGDLAPVLLHDPPRDVQAEAHALALGGVEGFEDAPQLLAADATPRVRKSSRIRFTRRLSCWTTASNACRSGSTVGPPSRANRLAAVTSATRGFRISLAGSPHASSGDCRSARS